MKFWSVRRVGERGKAKHAADRSIRDRLDRTDCRVCITIGIIMEDRRWF